MIFFCTCIAIRGWQTTQLKIVKTNGRMNRERVDKSPLSTIFGVDV